MGQDVNVCARYSPKVGEGCMDVCVHCVQILDMLWNNLTCDADIHRRLCCQAAFSRWCMRIRESTASLAHLVSSRI